MQDPTRLIQNNRLRCKFEKNNTVLFFSLVDYRNKLFTSNEPEKILEFYNGFENHDQLIQWVKERPKGVSYIHEVEGDKDIIVVIPTADFNGKYAINCRENIFKGLHLIFVESGGKDDIYFNYAHNCNEGIRRALYYDPNWVVITNDDMEKIDDIDSFIKQLQVLDNSVQIVFAPKGEKIVAEWQMRKINSLGLLVSYVLPKYNKSAYYADILRLRNKFDIKYVSFDSKFNFISWKDLFYKKMYKKTPEKFNISGVFNVMRAQYLRQVGPNFFDSTFINGSEDTDLYIKASRNGIISANISYKIKNLSGMTLGDGKNRNLREICNHSYLCLKMYKKE